MCGPREGRKTRLARPICLRDPTHEDSVVRPGTCRDRRCFPADQKQWRRSAPGELRGAVRHKLELVSRSKSLLTYPAEMTPPSEKSVLASPTCRREMRFSSPPTQVEEATPSAARVEAMAVSSTIARERSRAWRYRRLCLSRTEDDRNRYASDFKGGIWTMKRRRFLTGGMAMIALSRLAKALEDSSFFR